MKTSSIVAALLTICALSASAVASELPEGWSHPTVAHDGVRVMNAEGQSIESPYRYLPPGKHRQEMSQQGMSMAMIIREDLGVVWTVLPQNMYMEMSTDGADDASSTAAPGAEGVTEFDKIGTEEVNGWPTTKYRVVMEDDGKTADGYFWITEHWIPIRMEITMRDDPSQTMTMELRNLQIRDQDPAMFELPPGATKLAGMGGIGGMSQGDTGSFGFPGELADTAAETARETAKQETRQGVADGVREGIRSLFKR